MNDLNHKIRFFPYFMYTVFNRIEDTKEFSQYNRTNLEYMKWIYSGDNYSKVHNHIIKKPSEYLSSVIYSILYKKNKWDNIKLIKIKYILYLTFLIFQNKFFKINIDKDKKYDYNILSNALKSFYIKKSFLNYFRNKYYK